MQLKCIDNSNVETELTKGQLYELLTQNEKFFRVVIDKRTERSFFKERFSVVDAVKPPLSFPVADPSIVLHNASLIVVIDDVNHVARQCDFFRNNLDKIWVKCSPGFCRSAQGVCGDSYELGCYAADLPAEPVAQLIAGQKATCVFNGLITDFNDRYENLFDANGVLTVGKTYDIIKCDNNHSDDKYRATIKCDDNEVRTVFASRFSPVQQAQESGPVGTLFVSVEAGKTYLTACGIAVKMEQTCKAGLPYANIMGEEVSYNAYNGVVNTYHSSLTPEQIADYQIVETLDEDIPQPPAGYKLKDGGVYRCPKQYDYYVGKQHSLSVACCSLTSITRENKSDRHFLLTPNPPASVAKINDVVAKLGSVPVGGGVNCPLGTFWMPRVEQLWKPDEITNLCKEIKMVDKHVDCPGFVSRSELKSYNSDATVRKFVARGATYWLLEPAKTFGMIAVRSVRYIAFAGLLGGSGYVAYDPSAAMTAIKSCVPHVTIEAPSIMGEK